MINVSNVRKGVNNYSFNSEFFQSIKRVNEGIKKVIPTFRTPFDPKSKSVGQRFRERELVM